VPERNLATKTILAPDGSLIHYPNLPNVGEKYQPPGAPAHEVHSQQTAQSPTQAPTPPVANESWRERAMSAARSAVERAGMYGHAAVNALVLDDWKALTDAHSSTLQRIEGGASLASWAIPEGKVAEIATHAIAKAGELVAGHAAEQSVEHAIASGVERAAEHTQDAGAIAGRKWAERTPNQKLAQQHPMNPSTIWDRPLTPAERGGKFENANDLTAFLGPASERGGVAREWHHVVEKVHPDKYGQFPAEQVHSVENLVPVPRAAHRGENGLTAEFNTKDLELGTTLRERLKGKPWEKHVVEGERAMRERDLDPAALRAETRARFEQRLELRDRLNGLSKGHEADEISHGRGALGVIVHEGNSQNGDARSQASARSGGGNSWSPDMPFEDFAKLQAQIRGGSSSREAARGLSYERDGRLDVVRPGTKFLGSIQSVEGDRITQHIGLGNTVTWSREELGAHFKDQQTFDAAMQPGHMVAIGMGRNGVVDAQQQVPGHGWESLNQQPLQPWQQFEAQHLAHGHGR